MMRQHAKHALHAIGTGMLVGGLQQAEHLDMDWLLPGPLPALVLAATAWALSWLKEHENE